MVEIDCFLHYVPETQEMETFFEGASPIKVYVTISCEKVYYAVQKVTSLAYKFTGLNTFFQH